MRRLLAALLLLPAAAWAQQVDPRIAPQLVQALQAQIELQKAAFNASREDMETLRDKLCGLIPMQGKDVPECKKNGGPKAAE